MKNPEKMLRKGLGQAKTNLTSKSVGATGRTGRRDQDPQASATWTLDVKSLAGNRVIRGLNEPWHHRASHELPGNGIEFSANCNHNHLNMF